MGKFSTHNGDYYKHTKDGRIMYLAVVESNYDEADAGRIKVRIKGVDDHIKNNNLPYAFPFIQKFLHIVPKIGETVWVMTPDTKNPFTDRLYIGPIISQPQNLDKDPHVVSSTAGLAAGFSKFKVAPSTLPENKGVYPTNEEFAIQGRKNTDILFKDGEIQIRAGKFTTKDETTGIPKFNKENPTYIQLKQNVRIGDKSVGITNVVADKINLLTHEGGNPRFELNNQDDMISEETMREIIEKAHPMVYGDLLIEYLNLFKEALINHVHAYPGMKPEDLAGQVNIKKFLEFDVSRIISKNIRIN